MNKTKLESKVLDFIQRYSLILPEELVVVGVSGGADSVCLLHVLAKWRKGLGMKLQIAHLNHQLRGTESEADAEYVSNLAGSLGIPITIDSQDVAAYRIERNCSIEEAARELRYAFLTRVAREVGANRIAVGHTRDDQVETILMHILRGTGITGLCGLAPFSPMAYDSQEMPLRAEALSVAKGEGVAISVVGIPDIASSSSLTHVRDKLGNDKRERAFLDQGCQGIRQGLTCLSVVISQVFGCLEDILGAGFHSLSSISPW